MLHKSREIRHSGLIKVVLLDKSSSMEIYPDRAGKQSTDGLSWIFRHDTFYM
jgi:hypothetical protein